MITVGRHEIGISNFAIRCIAIVTMVVGGIGFIKGYGYDWLEAFGWTSFTLFAFLLSEGAAHSSDCVLYLRRFILFTVLGEMAYTYMRYKKLWLIRCHGVMATLFLGFIIIMIMQLLKKYYDNLVVEIAVLAALTYFASVFADRFNFHYGKYGVLIIVMFYVARNVKYSRILELFVLLYICFYLSSESLAYVSIAGLQYPVTPQLYCLIALPFIWLYDDVRGPNSLMLQICQYMAYPVFMMVLYIMKTKIFIN